jgi:multidrug efflux pump subunit AcrB
MNFRNISSWAIRNPVPPIVLFVALLLAGVVSFMRMDVNGQPDIEFPVVKRLGVAAGRRAQRTRNADHAAGRSGGSRRERR